MLGVLFADSDNAEAIMALEAMTQSKEWDSHRTGDVRAGQRAKKLFQKSFWRILQQILANCK